MRIAYHQQPSQVVPQEQAQPLPTDDDRPKPQRYSYNSGAPTGKSSAIQERLAQYQNAAQRVVQEERTQAPAVASGSGWTRVKDVVLDQDAKQVHLDVDKPQHRPKISLKQRMEMFRQNSALDAFERRIQSQKEEEMHQREVVVKAREGEKEDGGSLGAGGKRVHTVTPDRSAAKKPVDMPVLLRERMSAFRGQLEPLEEEDGSENRQRGQIDAGKAKKTVSIDVVANYVEPEEPEEAAPKASKPEPNEPKMSLKERMEMFRQNSSRDAFERRLQSLKEEALHERMSVFDGQLAPLSEEQEGQVDEERYRPSRPADMPDVDLKERMSIYSSTGASEGGGSVNQRPVDMPKLTSSQLKERMDAFADAERGEGAGEVRTTRPTDMPELDPNLLKDRMGVFSQPLDGVGEAKEGEDSIARKPADTPGVLSMYAFSHPRLESSGEADKTSVAQRPVEVTGSASLKERVDAFSKTAAGEEEAIVHAPTDMPDHVSLKERMDALSRPSASGETKDNLNHGPADMPALDPHLVSERREAYQMTSSSEEAVGVEKARSTSSKANDIPEEAMEAHKEETPLTKATGEEEEEGLESSEVEEAAEIEEALEQEPEREGEDESWMRWCSPDAPMAQEDSPAHEDAGDEEGEEKPEKEEQGKEDGPKEENIKHRPVDMPDVDPRQLQQRREVFSHPSRSTDEKEEGEGIPRRIPATLAGADQGRALAASTQMAPSMAVDAVSNQSEPLAEFEGDGEAATLVDVDIEAVASPSGVEEPSTAHSTAMPTRLLLPDLSAAEVEEEEAHDGSFNQSEQEGEEEGTALATVADIAAEDDKSQLEVQSSLGPPGVDGSVAAPVRVEANAVDTSNSSLDAGALVDQDGGAVNVGSPPGLTEPLPGKLSEEAELEVSSVESVLEEAETRPDETATAKEEGPNGANEAVAPQRTTVVVAPADAVAAMPTIAPEVALLLDGADEFSRASLDSVCTWPGCRFFQSEEYMNFLRYIAQENVERTLAQMAEEYASFLAYLNSPDTDDDEEGVPFDEEEHVLAENKSTEASDAEQARAPEGPVDLEQPTVDEWPANDEPPSMLDLQPVNEQSIPRSRYAKCQGQLARGAHCLHRCVGVSQIKR